VLVGCTGGKEDPNGVKRRGEDQKGIRTNYTGKLHCHQTIKHQARCSGYLGTGIKKHVKSGPATGVVHETIRRNDARGANEGGKKQDDL